MGDSIQKHLRVETIPQPLSLDRLQGTRPAFRAYNPSLARQQNTLVIAFRLSTMTRCTKRNIDFTRLYAGEEPPIENIIGTGIINPQTLGIEQAEELQIEPPRDCPWSIGYEDPRIFSFRDRTFIIASHRNTRWTFTQSLIELGSNRKVINVVPVVPDRGAEMHQKNWNPFVRDEKLFFVGSVVPHDVYSIDVDDGRATLLHSTSGGIFSDLNATYEVRGGAGYIRVGDEFVGVARAVLPQHPDENTNDYQCVAYSFAAEPPFRPLRRSQPFYLGVNDAPPLQMVLGLAEDGEDLIISFGERDCDLRVARITREALLQSLS